MKFKKILEFSYSHSYFDGGAAPGLFTIAPLAQTQELLANLQMQFKQTADGFFVYAQVASDKDPKYSIVPPEKSSLGFAVYSNEPCLANFTDMENITPAVNVFYCDCSDESDTKLDLDIFYPLQQKGLLVNTEPFTVSGVAG
ncbi:MAG: hypothetical protein R8K20_11215, partial [Gallionellaceae bacterium]